MINKTVLKQILASNQKAQSMMVCAQRGMSSV